MLYFARIELLRLTFGYFYILVLVTLLGYRWALRLWHRARRHGSGSPARILIVGAGKVGCEIVGEFQRRQWPGIQIAGFLDDAPDKQGCMIAGLPVLGTVDHAGAIIDQQRIDEVLVALPPEAHNRLANLVASLYEKPVPRSGGAGLF